jgi:photosystem II stability/assembly factor-like uncharacterized protein
VPSVVELTPVPTGVGAPADFVPAIIAFSDALHGVAGSVPNADAESPEIRSTQDGGRSWTARSRLAQPVRDIVIIGPDVWALIPCPENPDGRCGALLHSDDGGATWGLVPSTGAVPHAAGAISFLSASVGWALGYADGGDGTVGGSGLNRLLKTADGGVTWSAEPVPCGADWPDIVSVRFVDMTHGWAVCTGAGSGTMAPTQVLETDDGGKTWTTRSSASNFGGPVVRVGRPPSGPVGGSVFTAESNGWVWEGRSGTERSLDGGATWAATGPGRPEETFVSSMSFPTEMDGFAVYTSGELDATILAGTTDGGTTWEIVQSWRNR